MLPNKRPKSEPDEQPPVKKTSSDEEDCKTEEGCAGMESHVMGDHSGQHFFPEEPVVPDIPAGDRFFGFDQAITECFAIEPIASGTIKLEDGTRLRIEYGIEIEDPIKKIKQERQEPIGGESEVPTEDNPEHPPESLGVVVKEEPNTLEDTQLEDTTNQNADLLAQAIPLYFYKHAIGFYKEVELESPTEQKPESFREPQPSGSRETQPSGSKEPHPAPIRESKVDKTTSVADGDQWTFTEPSQPTTSSGTEAYDEQWTVPTPPQPSTTSGSGVYNKQWTFPTPPQPSTTSGSGVYNEQWTFPTPPQLSTLSGSGAYKEPGTFTEPRPLTSSGPQVYNEPRNFIELQPTAPRKRQSEGLRLRELEFLRDPKFANIREPPPAHSTKPQSFFREMQFGVIREPPPAHYRGPHVPLYIREPHLMEPRFGVLREPYRQPKPAHFRQPHPVPQPSSSGFPILPQYGLYGIQAPLYKTSPIETRPGAYGMQEREHCRGQRPGTSRDRQPKIVRQLQPPPGVSREPQTKEPRSRSSREPQHIRDPQPGTNTILFNEPQTSTFRQPPSATYMLPPLQILQAPQPPLRRSDLIIHDRNFLRMSPSELAARYNPAAAIIEQVHQYCKPKPKPSKRKNSSFASREELERYLRSEQAREATQFSQGFRTADPPATEEAQTSIKAEGDEAQPESGMKRRNEGEDEEKTASKKQKKD